MPDYRNEIWESQDIRTEQDKEEGTTADEGRRKHDTAERKERAEKKVETYNTHVDNSGTQKMSSTMQTEAIEVKGDDDKKRNRDNSEDTQDGRPHDNIRKVLSERTTEPNEHTNMKRKQDQQGGTEERKERDNVASDKKKNEERKQCGPSDAVNRKEEKRNRANGGT